MAMRVCLLLYRKDFIAQAEKLTSSQCCEPKGAALGKFPGREITSAISHTHRFRWVREVASCPSLHLFRINVARFVKKHPSLGALRTRSVLGFSLAG
jgi:hypothetical protein